MSDEHKNETRKEIGEDLNIASILMIGLCYALVVAIAMVMLAALHNKKTRTETEAKSATTGASALEEARAQQATRIGSYEWVDYGAGAIRLPIERAMELATERLAAGEPLGLAPVATPVTETDDAPVLSDTNTGVEDVVPELGTEE